MTAALPIWLRFHCPIADQPPTGVVDELLGPKAGCVQAAMATVPAPSRATATHAVVMATSSTATPAMALPLIVTTGGASFARSGGQLAR